jgi:hypothetical protein
LATLGQQLPAFAIPPRRSLLARRVTPRRRSRTKTSVRGSSPGPRCGTRGRRSGRARFDAVEQNATKRPFGDSDGRQLHALLARPRLLRLTSRVRPRRRSRRYTSWSSGRWTASADRFFASESNTTIRPSREMSAWRLWPSPCASCVLTLTSCRVAAATAAAPNMAPVVPAAAPAHP